MKWEIATAQSKGGRDNQEDALVVLDQRRGEPLVLVLADGAGGHADGEHASQAAIACVQTAFAAAPIDETAAGTWLTQTTLKANQAVTALGEGGAAPRTTLAIAWLRGSAARFSHVGDSRIYHFRAGQALYRSRDDSVVQLLVDMKKIGLAEAAHHPDRNRLLKALGAEGLEVNPVAEAVLGPGDGLVLCSDGIWEHVEEKDLAAALAQRDLEKAATDLVRTAVGKGGANADNASVILARLG